MKTILVATDFSPAATHACNYAAAMANDLQAKLILFNTYHIPVPSAEVPVIVITPDELEKDVKRGLESAVKILTTNYPDLKIEIDYAPGFAAQEINAASIKHKADVVIVGLQGAGKLSELLVGSTATDIIKRSKIPALIVPSVAHYVSPKQIAFAADLKKIHQKTIDTLNEWVSVFKAKLFVVNVVKPESIPVLEEASAGVALDRLLSNVNHELFFSENEEVTEGINNFIKSHSCELLIMMPHKHSFWETLFHESNTKKMAFHTHTPILTIPN